MKFQRWGYECFRIFYTSATSALRTVGIIFNSCMDERCQHWLRVCRRDDLLAKQDWSVNQRYAVCSDHFIGNYFENSSHTKLVEGAVPTIFPNWQTDECDQSELHDEEELIIKSEPEDPNEDDLSMWCDIQLCRLCANAVDDAVYIFSAEGFKLGLANKINTILPVMVQESDPLPKQLCTSCKEKVDMCQKFADTCIEAEDKLYSILRLKNFRSQKLILRCKKEITGEQPVDEDCNDKDSQSSEVNEDAMYTCPLCCKGVVCLMNSDKRMKTECDNSEELSVDSNSEHSLDNNFSDPCILGLDNTWSDDGSADLESSGVVCDMLASAATETSSEWWNFTEIMDGNRLLMNSLNEEHMEVKVNPRNTVTAEPDDNALPFCCLCGQTFSLIEQCLEHSKAHYQQDSNHYPCSVCGKSFTVERELTEHHKEHRPQENKMRIKGKRLCCNICGRRFNTERTFVNHSCATPETKQFRCTVCKKSYSSEERLAFHQKFHEGARLNFCEKCGKEFDNEGSLYYHTRMVHDGERPFSCSICSKKFYSNARLLAHKRVHTGERPFECEVCGRRFYDRETLKGHYVTHMSVKPFQCDLCGMCWGRKSMLNQHLRTHHSDSHLPRRVPSLIHYHCRLCNTTFTSSADVMTHRTTHWNTMENSHNHLCEYCGESFSLTSALGRHRKEEHPDEKPYICSLCKEGSHTLYEARAHRKTHIEQDSKEKLEEDKLEKPFVFVCEACGHIFTEKRKFLRHLKQHKVGKPFQCKVCGKEFTDNPRLTVHMRQHTGEKPYTCTVCSKSFSQTSALYTHALLHTGEKPHSCDLCGKAFRIKADRDNHRRTHTGEKPYKCEFCGKTFRTGQVYYQHRMIHTGERRFPCDVCGKAFKRSHTLVVHKRIHTGEKPNICDVCGKGFRQRSDMRKHRALHGPCD
ncbi:zinc finger protein 665 isoform X2 [Anabrus simplex]|uniref:zinc finger protein 665 isoform X2 n=1 Tax=Anabrus simplex TaxID=316456 RepID=UPI0035A275FC